MDLDTHKPILGCILGGLVGGIAIATTWRFAPQADFWTILSAIGTIGATVVALTIAISDQIRRRKEAETQARIAVAALLPEIEFVLSGLAATRSYIQELIGSPVTPTSVQNVVSFVDGMQVLEPLRGTALTGVSRDAATTFSHAIARLAQLKRSLGLIKDHFTGPHMTEEQRQAELQRWCGTISFVHTALSAVYTDCNDRIRVDGKPKPSPQAVRA